MPIPDDAKIKCPECGIPINGGVKGFAHHLYWDCWSDDKKRGFVFSHEICWCMGYDKPCSMRENCKALENHFNEFDTIEDLQDHILLARLGLKYQDTV